MIRLDFNAFYERQSLCHTVYLSFLCEMRPSTQSTEIICVAEALLHSLLKLLV